MTRRVIPIVVLFICTPTTFQYTNNPALQQTLGIRRVDGVPQVPAMFPGDLLGRGIGQTGGSIGEFTSEKRYLAFDAEYQRRSSAITFWTIDTSPVYTRHSRSY